MEVVVRFLIVVVRTIWAWGDFAFLLQLDLKGAFDIIHHTILLIILKKLDTPQRVLEWLQNYLQNQQMNLSFNRETTFFTIPSGVP